MTLKMTFSVCFMHENENFFFFYGSRTNRQTYEQSIFCLLCILKIMMSPIYPYSMSVRMCVCIAIYGHGTVRSQEAPGRYQTRPALPRQLPRAAWLGSPYQQRKLLACPALPAMVYELHQWGRPPYAVHQSSITHTL